MGKILFLCFLPGTYPDPVPDPADALPNVESSPSFYDVLIDIYDALL